MAKPKTKVKQQHGVEERSIHLKFKFKIVLVGAMGVGKTSLIMQHLNKSFTPNMRSTILDFFHKTIVINGTIIVLEIWDTAGQEKFHSLTNMFYRNAHAVIVVYDITNKKSFDRVPFHCNEFTSKTFMSHGVMAIVGNKTDLKDKREVKSEEGLAFADENGYLFMETSAKSAANVDTLFAAIAKDLYDREMFETYGDDWLQSQVVDLDKIRVLSASDAVSAHDKKKSRKKCLLF